ncbi:MAG TPA: helix-turn-helix transcriptional regulator [Methylomirabilota bacterium]
MIPKVVPSDITVYGEINPPRRRFRFMWEPRATGFPGWEEVFRQHLPEHPFAQRYQGGGNGEAVKISDLVSLRQFQQLGFYEELFRRLGVDREMIVWLPTTPPMEVTIGVHRVRGDFSERDRLLLNVLRPHLLQAYRNAEAVTLLQAAPDGNRTSLGIVLVGPSVRVTQVNDAAQRLIEAYFGRLGGARLPDELERWVRHQKTLFTDPSSDAPSVRAPLVARRDGQCLTVRLLVGPTQDLLLLEEHRTAPSSQGLMALGLTQREGEVLTWVAQGKSNEEVARILDLSQRTVEKHLEKIYQKLGVENRTAAAMRAREALSAPAAGGPDEVGKVGLFSSIRTPP